MTHRAFNALTDMCSMVQVYASSSDSGLLQCNVCHSRRGKKTTIVNNHLQKPESGMCYQAYSTAKERLTSCFHSEETIAAVVKECIEQAQAEDAVKPRSRGSTSAVTSEGSRRSRKEKRLRLEDAFGEVGRAMISDEADDDSVKLQELLHHMQLCAITKRPTCGYPHCHTGRAMLLGLLMNAPERAQSGPLPAHRWAASGTPRSQGHLPPARSLGAPLPVFGSCRLIEDSLGVNAFGFQAEDELPVNEDLLKMLLQDLGNPEGGLMSSSSGVGGRVGV